SAVGQYVNAVRSVSSSADVDNQFLEGGYDGMLLFVQALKAVGPNLTRASLRHVLDSMTFDSGLSQPLSWQAGNHFANRQMLRFAVGIVVIYRASRVLNLAHGALALVPAYVFYSLGKHGMPLVVAAACGVAGGAFLGLVTERVVVRRLRTQGPVAQTVGTVAVYGFVLAMVVKLYGSA